MTSIVAPIPTEVFDELCTQTSESAVELYTPIAEQVAKICGYSKQVELEAKTSIKYTEKANTWDSTTTLTLKFPGLSEYDVFDVALSEIVKAGFQQILNN